MTDAYHAVCNSPPMCALSTLNTRSCSSERDFVTGSIKYSINGLDIRFEADDIGDVIRTFDSNTMKTLDILTLYLTKSKSRDTLGNDEAPTVIIPLSEYLSLCGRNNTKPNRDRARTALDEAFETLFAVRIAYRSKTKAARKRVEISGDTRICVEKGSINNNIIYFRFSPKMARYLLESFITVFDTRIFALDERNPNTYALARKLLTHYGMDTNIKNRTNGRLNLKTALCSCPMIPPPDTVKTSDRHVYRRTVAPLIDALDRIRAKTGLRYTLMREGGCISADDIRMGGIDDVYISFYFEGYPDQNDRIKSKDKARRKAQKKAAEV